MKKEIKKMKREKTTMLQKIWNFIRMIIKKIFKKGSDSQSWAEREIDIACKRERADSKTPKGKWDYGCACYESALKAYKSLLKDGHSGFSIGQTQRILNRLIEHKPLTPIVDTPDIWNHIADISGLKGKEVNYQCKRMSSLFKCVYADGSIKYKDIDSYYCVNVDDMSTYHSGLVQKIIDEMYPITMPYYPIAPIKVYCQEFLTDRKNGDFDTFGVLYLIKPEMYGYTTRVEINRFFKETDKGWDEITIEEYKRRQELAEERIEAEKNSAGGYMYGKLGSYKNVAPFDIEGK